MTEVKSTEDLYSLLSKEELDFRFSCGYTKPTSKVEVKDVDGLIVFCVAPPCLCLLHAELENGFHETLQVITFHTSEMPRCFKH